METTLNAMDFRNAMSRFASGVTIVTTRNGDGGFVGFTASSFCSVSLDPPLLLVCLQNDADSYPAFMSAHHFAVSVLALGQADIARRFATKAIDKLQDTHTAPGTQTGLPLIVGAAGALECRIWERIDAGDHTILIGLVIDADSTDSDPLLFFNREFGHFSQGETRA